MSRRPIPVRDLALLLAAVLAYLLPAYSAAQKRLDLTFQRPHIVGVGIDERQIDFELLSRLGAELDIDVAAVLLMEGGLPANTRDVPVLSCAAILGTGPDDLSELLEWLRPTIIIWPDWELLPPFAYPRIGRVISNLEEDYSFPSRRQQFMVLNPQERGTGRYPLVLANRRGGKALYFYNGAYYSRPTNDRGVDALRSLRHRPIEQVPPSAEDSLDLLHVHIVPEEDTAVLVRGADVLELICSIVNVGTTEYHVESLTVATIAPEWKQPIDLDILPFGEVKRKVAIPIDPLLAEELGDFTGHLQLRMHYFADSARHGTSTTHIPFKFVDAVTVSLIPDRLALPPSLESERPDWQIHSQDVLVRFANNSGNTRMVRPGVKTPDGVSAGVFPAELTLPPRSTITQNLKLNFELTGTEEKAEVVVHSAVGDFWPVSFSIQYRSGSQVNTLIVSEFPLNWRAPFTAMSRWQFETVGPAEVSTYDNLILSPGCVDDYTAGIIGDFIAGGGTVVEQAEILTSEPKSNFLRDWTRFTLDSSAVILRRRGHQQDTLSTPPYLAIPYQEQDPPAESDAVCEMILADRKTTLWWVDEVGDGRRIITCFDPTAMRDDDLYAILLDMIEK